MAEISQTPQHPFNLEERTLRFSKDVAIFCKLLPGDVAI